MPHPYVALSFYTPPHLSRQKVPKIWLKITSLFANKNIFSFASWEHRLITLLVLSTINESYSLYILPLLHIEFHAGSWNLFLWWNQGSGFTWIAIIERVRELLMACAEFYSLLIDFFQYLERREWYFMVFIFSYWVLLCIPGWSQTHNFLSQFFHCCD